MLYRAISQQSPGRMVYVFRSRRERNELLRRDYLARAATALDVQCAFREEGTYTRYARPEMSCME
jgi:predicted RNA-binding protein YlxR (DUF448 family)